MAYQVFISYKHTTMDGSGVTRDYAIASELHNALTRAGVKTFFSEKDLSTGDYINEIYDALDEAVIMIVVGTKSEHIRSKWVKEEWSTFIAEINGGRKPNGDVYTYLEGMPVNELPSMLYKRQSYTTSEKDKLIDRIISQLGIKRANTSDTSSETFQPPVPKAEPKPQQPATATKPAPAPIFRDSAPKQEQMKPVIQKLVKHTPLIVTVAVVLVIAMVSGIWAISNFNSNETNDSTDNSSESSEKTGSQIDISDLSGLNAVYNGEYYTFTFGNYPQGANGEEQPIEWRVLAVESGKALVISEKLLDCVLYNETYSNVTWETCTLRKWMNTDFINKAFSSSEQAKITTVTNQNPDNLKYGTSGGNTTQDKIFALSIDEAEKYFGNDDDRMAAPTDYAKKQGCFVSDDYSLPNGEKTGWWWLRSTGLGSSRAADVSRFGRIYRYGSDVSRSIGCVRPAFWLNL